MLRKAISVFTLPVCMVVASCHKAPSATPLAVRSPDGRTEIVAGRLKSGGLAVRIRHDGRDVIAPSEVGLVPDGDAYGPVAVEGSQPIASANGGEASHGELLVKARERGGSKRALLLRLRAYDQGAAFRLELPPEPREGNIRLAAETTALRFPRDYACLAVRHAKYLNSHEGDYAPVRASALQPDALYDLPLSCATGRGGETIAITESGVENYPGAYLVKGQSLGVALRLTPLPAADHLAAILPRRQGLRTGWRTVLIADRPEQMIASTLVHDLAAPSRIAHAGWIKPGKASWGWWAGVKTSGVPDAGFNNPTYRHYIDFAARFGLPYFVIDWGWAARPNGDKSLADVTRFRPGVDIPALSRYAAARGVRLWLWTNWDAIGRDMDHVFALYERWGIAGIKVDYVYRQDQIAIGYYHRLLAAAARHHLMVNIHGAPVPRGLERTYPNLMTEEGVMGAEYNKWSRSVTAGHNVRLAYSRAIVGPMDYTPGGFRNTTPAAFKVRHTLPQVMTTRAQQLAMFVVYPSPLQSLADAPSAYVDAAGHLAPGSAFLRLVPASWDETHGITGEWGQWIAVARRSGKRWFVGIMGDEQRRIVTIPFDFLGSGHWHMRAWVDGGKPTDTAGHSGTIRAGTKLRVPLAPSGGAVMILDPA